MTACFDACAQKFFDEFVLHLAPTAISLDLRTGGTFAHGLEAARRVLYPTAEKPTKALLEQALLSSTREMMLFWGDYEAPPRITAKGERVYAIKDLTNTINALYDYFEHYPPWDDPMQPYFMADGQPAVEFTFAIPVNVEHPQTGQPLIYCGRCDLIAEYKNLLAVVDEKTAKSVSGEAWLKKWDMRGQFIGYVWGAQQHGFPIHTAIVRGIGMMVKTFEHREAIIEYPQWQINLWHQQLERKLQRMVDMFKAMEQRNPHEAWDYSFGDACSAYGCCQYIGLCTSEEPELWYADYDERIWDPLAKDPTSKGTSRLAKMESLDFAAAKEGA